MRRGDEGKNAPSMALVTPKHDANSAVINSTDGIDTRAIVVPAHRHPWTPPQSSSPTRSKGDGTVYTAAQHNSRPSGIRSDNRAIASERHPR
jgi:hypothetical protein